MNPRQLLPPFSGGRTISQTNQTSQTCTLPSPFQIPAASPFHNARQVASNASVPHTILAPGPVGFVHRDALKRLQEQEQEEYLEYRNKSTRIESPNELDEENQLLLKLAARLQTDVGKSYPERMRTWNGDDIKALEQAYEYWEKFQFNIIAAKMKDFGASKRWSAQNCEQKWKEMQPGRGLSCARSPPLWEASFSNTFGTPR